MEVNWKTKAHVGECLKMDIGEISHEQASSG
jgi:hypothetical protein